MSEGNYSAANEPRSLFTHHLPGRGQDGKRPLFSLIPATIPYFSCQTPILTFLKLVSLSTSFLIYLLFVPLFPI